VRQLGPPGGVQEKKKKSIMLFDDRRGDEGARGGEPLFKRVFVKRRFWPRKGKTATQGGEHGRTVWGRESLRPGRRVAPLERDGGPDNLPEERTQKQKKRERMKEGERTGHPSLNKK